MKVAHFNTFVDGGAAVLMLRLHRALLDAGVDSHVYHRKGQVLDRGGHRLEFAGTSRTKLQERIKWRWENVLLRRQGNMFSTVWAPAKTPFEEKCRSADIIHLHWVSRWLDLPSFVASLPREAPIVMTIHDMGLFTGGCHLYSGCRGFEADCNPCPLLKPPFDRIVARRELERKLRCVQGRGIHVVGNSMWTTGLAELASVFRLAASLRTIPPGIDPAEFNRFDKAEAKSVLGIAANRFVVGFGCAELSDENKNFSMFLDLVRALAASVDLEVVVFGNGFRLDSACPVRLHNLGNLASGRILSLAYSAMDVFVMTSRVETFGQVAVEAQACGTPVCAFDVGGVPEAVEHGVTGLLSQFGCVQALAANVRRLAEDGCLLAAFRQRAFESVREKFTMEASCRAYRDLYEEALAGARRHSGRCEPRSY